MPDLGSVYLRADDKAKAERQARQALALDPHMLVANLNLASLLAEHQWTGGRRRGTATAALAYTGAAICSSSRRSQRSSLTVLMPTTAESGNVPLDHLMPRDRFSRLRWVVEVRRRKTQVRSTCPPYDPGL